MSGTPSDFGPVRTMPRPSSRDAPTGNPLVAAPASHIKFRAECMNDVFNLIKLPGIHRHLKRFTVETVDIGGILVPDVDADVLVDMTLEEFIKVAKEVEDGHVIFQTAQYPPNYTGERDSSR